MEVVWALIGAIFGLLLTLFVQPFLESTSSSLLVRIFGSTRRKKQSLSGPWQQKWHVESTSAPSANESTLQLKQLGRRVSAEFKSLGRTYCINGEISQGTYLTGSWYDEAEGSTYHGAFQLRIRPNDDAMIGKWIGFAESGEIKGGLWEWRRASPGSSAQV